MTGILLIVLGTIFIYLAISNAAGEAVEGTFNRIGLRVPNSRNGSNGGTVV